MNYVVGVSGGVDSVVLLDMLAHNEIELAESGRIIVAHFDHGIRKESSGDAEFVQKLAEHHGFQFELGKAKLGEGASEEEARDMRYDFLRRCCKQYKAKLMLAHHRDDILETMIINLVRGTSWRGLVSLRSTDKVIRPLLQTSKAELVRRAEGHRLKWVEDATNTDETYLRNYIRHTLIPRAQAGDGSFSYRMFTIQKRLAKLRPKIESEVSQLIGPAKVSDASYICPRYSLVMWPADVSQEYVYQVLTTLNQNWHPQEHQIIRALHFAKTAQPGKILTIAKGLKLHSQKRHIEFIKH